ncbi:acyltransferase family protein [Mesobacillus sp. AQ2]|uniref:acyltransferase family protein n=1 Tax=Mesobacillus sp. AQ2 TaxID=3043332 RepID=UPI0024C11DCC|nr:acyltransferase family protein [Mesobacillus sp. AQ2]WHX40270.1 acyltransferase family protein [Mesobacillus sp. AQ2]
MKYNHTIDKLKFFAAIAVVLIHTTGSLQQFNLATLTNYYSYRPLLDLAVPFFFAASGYFLSGKTVSYLPGYLKKILSIYISFTIFYLLFKLLITFTDRLLLGTAFWNGINSFLKGLTFQGLINGTLGSFHLWFLTALIISALLLFICLRLSIKSEMIFVLAAILYFSNLVGILNFNDVFMYGGFAKGFFYLAMGFYLGNKDISKLKWPLAGLVSSILILTLLSYYHSSLNVLFLMSATYYLLVYAVQNPGEKSYLSNWGSYSLNIYILHIFVYQSINKISIYSGITEYYKFPYYYLTTTLLALVIPILLYRPVDKFLAAPVTQWVHNITFILKEKSAK